MRRHPPGHLTSRPRSHLTGRLLALPVLAYRRVLSPLLPPRCRFAPTCSAYTVEALRAHGAVRGGWLALRRIVRCHPFHPGGWDPVPPVASVAAPLPAHCPSPAVPVRPGALP